MKTKKLILKYLDGSESDYLDSLVSKISKFPSIAKLFLYIT